MRGGLLLNAEILVHNPEMVSEDTLEAVTATVSGLGVGVLHTLIGPNPFETALTRALARSDLTLVIGADHPLIQQTAKRLHLQMRPSRRAASYISAACAAEGIPLTDAMRALALMPTGSTVMGCNGSTHLGCGLVLRGRGLVLLPALPTSDLLSGDFVTFISDLLLSHALRQGPGEKPAPLAPLSPAAPADPVILTRADIITPPPMEAPPEDAPKAATDETPKAAEADPPDMLTPLPETPKTEDPPAPDKKSRTPLLILTACAALCLAVVGYPRIAPLLSGRTVVEPVAAPEPVPLKEHHYAYLRQDVYDTLFPDSGADQLALIDAIADGTASSIPEEPDPPPPSSTPASSTPPASSSQPPVSSAPPPVSSSQPPVSSSAPPPSSSTPPVSSSEPSPQSSQPPESTSREPEEGVVVIYYPDDEDPDENPQEDPQDDTADPPDTDYNYDETLSVTVNGSVIRLNAYDLVCQIVQVEMGGSLDTEALKAQAVAAYTYIKYNNARGLAPSVGRNTNVNSKVQSAVQEVLGRAVYYDGAYINAVYHSTSCGSTTSAKSVWGGNVPYLVSVDSEWDSASPYFSTRYTIGADSFRQKARDTYGIELSGDPTGWIEVDSDSMSDGGYVGRVYIGGYSTSQGGKIASGTAITGRNVREVLLGFGLRSHCFEVHYDGQNFVFNTYGYGHGVGLSQYGAHFMARQGYDYIEILEHYYSGAIVR